MVSLLAELFLENELPDIQIQPNYAVIYQHIKVFDGELRVRGEHVMDEAKGLQIVKDFWGAHEAITNMTADKGHVGRVATLIVKARSLDSAKKRMARVIQRIMDEYGLDRYSDPGPNKKGRLA
ncbi:hypothetical protein GWO13_05575 [Candidatus Bathyarchaeota archaeon]|nr:hypothetical protein [Candidatus Bathyarchaeota archaeon]